MCVIGPSHDTPNDVRAARFHVAVVQAAQTGNGDKPPVSVAGAARRLAARRRRELMTGSGERELARPLSRHHTGQHSVRWCVYVCLHQCICPDRAQCDGAETRQQWIRKRGGRVRMALGILHGPRGKAPLVFPELGGHVFPISGQLRVVSLSSEGAEP